MGWLVGVAGVAIATPAAAVIIELIRKIYVQESDAPEEEASPSPPAQSD